MSDFEICNSDKMGQLLQELASAVNAAHPDKSGLILIGIERRGADIARRIAKLIAAPDMEAQTASLDINLYRDDWKNLKGGAPSVGKSNMPCSPDDKSILLVDDVLFSGRTARAAMEAILDYGRPRKIELLALVDRGHRELPIQPDYTGIVLETDKDQHVEVLLSECDGRDAVLLRQR